MNFNCNVLSFCSYIVENIIVIASYNFVKVERNWLAYNYIQLLKQIASMHTDIQENNKVLHGTVL